MRGAMLSILHRFVQHDTWTKISMENGAKSDRLAAAARALFHRPAAHLLRAQRTSPSQESRKELEGKKARKVAACCLRPRELGAALSSRGQSGSVRQLLTNYVAACSPPVDGIALDGNWTDGERSKKSAVKIWGMAGRNKTKWSKAER